MEGKLRDCIWVLGWVLSFSKRWRPFKDTNFGNGNHMEYATSQTLAGNTFSWVLFSIEVILHVEQTHTLGKNPKP